MKDAGDPPASPGAEPRRLPHRLLASLPATVATALVLGLYVFFASGGTWEFRRLHWYDTIYANLGEGFLRGELGLAAQPDPRLGQLSNPYEKEQRESANIQYFWDTSYYRGKYYLYFSPVPVLLFHLPFRLIDGGWPMDQLASAFFSAWALLAGIAFVREAVRRVAGGAHIPLFVWILLIGLGNLVPFTLVAIRVYEVSILAGMAMSATWAWTTMRFLVSGRFRDAGWSGFWLGMAIASRPNLIFLLVVQLFVLRGIIPWRRLRAVAVAMLIPLALTGGAVAAYNAARFGNPLEFGVSYQLTGKDMRKHSVCSLCSVPEGIRLVNNVIQYTFFAPAVTSQFPFVLLAWPRLDPDVSYPGSEPHAGVGALVPLTLLGTLFGAMLALRSGATDPGTRGGTLALMAGWVALLGLSGCWYLVGRYTLDFTMLMTIGSAVCIESGLGWLRVTGVRIRPLRAVVLLLALYSTLLGVALGFQGPGEAFRNSNPALYEQVRSWFSG